MGLEAKLAGRTIPDRWQLHCRDLALVAIGEQSSHTNVGRVVATCWSHWL